MVIIKISTEKKMADTKEMRFSKPPILKKFSGKFHGLVLRLVGMIDAMGIDVTQPTMWNVNGVSSRSITFRIELIHTLLLSRFIPFSAVAVSPTSLLDKLIGQPCGFQVSLGFIRNTKY